MILSQDQLNACWADIKVHEVCRQYFLQAGSARAAEVYARAIARVKHYMVQRGVVL